MAEGKTARVEEVAAREERKGRPSGLNTVELLKAGGGGSDLPAPPLWLLNLVTLDGR